MTTLLNVSNSSNSSRSIHYNRRTSIVSSNVLHTDLLQVVLANDIYLLTSHLLSVTWLQADQITRVNIRLDYARFDGRPSSRFHQGLQGFELRLWVGPRYLGTPRCESAQTIDIVYYHN